MGPPTSGFGISDCTRLGICVPNFGASGLVVGR